jgi:hypothetical protein
MAVIVGVIAIVCRTWQHNPSGSSQSSSPVLPLLTRVETSFQRYATALHPSGNRPDRIVLEEEMMRMRNDMVQLDATLTALDSLESLTIDEVQRVHSLPLRALNALVVHRSGVVKEMIAVELHGLPYVTSDVVDKFDRESGAFMLAPLKLLLSYAHHFRWTELIHGQQTSAIEFAVDRELVEAVKIMLPHARQECRLSMHATSTSRLSAVQLAENNGNSAMVQLLIEDANPCLVTSLLDADRLRQRDAILARPVDLSAFELSAVTRGVDPRSVLGGGWRASASNATARSLSSIATLGCPFTRISLHQLTAEIFRAHYDNKQPIILTEALDTSRWTIAQQLTREYIANHWATINVTAGQIPYGKQFNVKNGLVSFDEFLSYMDGVYQRQQRAPAADELPPFYIFDHSMFDAAEWNLQSNASHESSSSSSNRSLGPSFYRLPVQVLSVFHTTSPVSQFYPQFYLGSEGSGAPFHYHCPALNMLVYGRKRSGEQSHDALDLHARAVMTSTSCTHSLAVWCFLCASFPVPQLVASSSRAWLLLETITTRIFPRFEHVCPSLAAVCLCAASWRSPLRAASMESRDSE